MIARARSGEIRTREDLLAVIALALVASGYFVVRFGGIWAEVDTGLMSHAIRIVVDSGQLTPTAEGVYSNGFGYQAVSLTIMAFTGLDIPTLQQLVYPLLSTLIVLPAWALYRELTGSARAATLATLLLLLVPEHLFAMFRGSHERLDRTFLFIALWLLVRSLRFRGDRRRFAIHLGLVLLTTYGLVATNALFGMSFVAVLATATALSWVAGRGLASVQRLASEAIPVLGWTCAAGALLLAVFIVFLYPPFNSSLTLLLAIPSRLLALLTTGGGNFDPYAYVASGWVSPAAFLLLSTMNFVLLVLSALVWLFLGWRWLRGGVPRSIGIWILWLLYAAFAVQGAVSIVSDRTGALQGNVQYRIFALFAPMATPLVAVVISRWNPRPWQRRLTVVALGFAAVAALMKSTLEPALSNKWLFYSTAEIEGLRWADAHQQSTRTWVGPDERLDSAYQLEVGLPTGTNVWATYDPPSDISSLLVSAAILRQSARLGVTVPELDSRNVVYDNGEAQLYRQRPGGTPTP